MRYLDNLLGLDGGSQCRTVLQCIATMMSDLFEVTFEFSNNFRFMSKQDRRYSDPKARND